MEILPQNETKGRPFFEHFKGFSHGADNGNRTHLYGLGSRRSTDELYPRILFTDVLYQNMPEKSSDKKGFIACDSSEYALAGV